MYLLRLLQLIGYRISQLNYWWILILIIALLLMLFNRINKRRKIIQWRTGYYCSWLLFALLLLAISMIISRDTLPIEYWHKNVSVDISTLFMSRPGKFGLFDTIIEAILNVIAFIPIGYFLSKLVKGGIVPLSISLLFIVMIETLQLITKRGFFELTDILLNFFGAIIGFVIARKGDN